MGWLDSSRSLEALLVACLLVAFSVQSMEAGTIFITNRGSGNLAILDAASLTVRKVLPVGKEELSLK